MSENPEEVARSLHGLKKFRIQIKASGTFEGTADDQEEAEKVIKQKRI